MFSQGLFIMVFLGLPTPIPLGHPCVHLGRYSASLEQQGAGVGRVGSPQCWLKDGSIWKREASPTVLQISGFGGLGA